MNRFLLIAFLVASAAAWGESPERERTEMQVDFARAADRSLGNPAATFADDEAFFNHPYFARRVRGIGLRYASGGIDENDIEEITQEVRLRIFRFGRENTTDIVGLVDVAAGRLYLNRVRGRMRRGWVLQLPEWEDGEQIELSIDEARARVRRRAEGTGAADEVELVRVAFESLGPRFQAALQPYLDGLEPTYEESAARFGISRKAFKSLLRRARLALSSAYIALGGEFPCRLYTSLESRT